MSSLSCALRAPSNLRAVQQRQQRLHSASLWSPAPQGLLAAPQHRQRLAPVAVFQPGGGEKKTLKREEEPEE